MPGRPGQRRDRADNARQVRQCHFRRHAVARRPGRHVPAASHLPARDHHPGLRPVNIIQQLAASAWRVTPFQGGHPCYVELLIKGAEHYPTGTGFQHPVPVGASTKRLILD